MKVLIINNSSKHLRAVKKLFTRDQITLVAYNQPLPSQTTFDLIILTGGSKSIVGHSKLYKNELALIKKAKAPLLGICLGAELIARAYKGKLKYLPKKRKGEFNIKRDEKTLKVYEAHHWAIAQLPKWFQIIASSEDGIEIFRHKTKPLAGVQFHPEMLIRKSDGARVFKEILSEILAN